MLQFGSDVHGKFEENLSNVIRELRLNCGWGYASIYGDKTQKFGVLNKVQHRNKSTSRIQASLFRKAEINKRNKVTTDKCLKILAL